MSSSTDQALPVPATSGGALPREPRTLAKARAAKGLKTFLVRLHRYAGLGAGLVLVAAGISGTMIAVEGTLLPPSFVAEHHRVEPQAQRAPLEPVLVELRGRYGQMPTQLTVRGDAALPDEYRISRRETAYVDPYTGDILAPAADFRTPFSRAIWDFHSSLLLGRTGEWVVLIATGTLLVSLLGGLILGVYELRLQGWRALSLRWTGNGRSWNRRFHSLMGFLWAPILIAIAASSAYRAFPAVENLTMRTLGVPVERLPEPRSDPSKGVQPLTPDAALRQLGLLDGSAQFDRLRLHFPQAPHDTFRVQVLGTDGRHARESFFLDQYTGGRLVDPHRELRIRREETSDLIRSLHSGSFHGSAVRGLWGTASAMVAVFAVSGLLIWLPKARVRRRASGRLHGGKRQQAPG